MKKLLIGLFAAALAFLPLAGPPARAQTGLGGAITCNRSVVYDASTNGSTKLISNGGTVYVCGYTLMAGGTASVKFISGTGTACATGTVALTPAYNLVAQSVVGESSAFFRGLTAPAGQDFCINTSAGVAVQAIVYFAQF